jgi:hypothetical protein
MAGIGRCGATTLSITTFSIIAEHFYADCHLCSLSLMLSVTCNPFILSVIMLNVVMLNVVMLGVVMLRVVMLSVVAPWKHHVAIMQYYYHLRKFYCTDPRVDLYKIVTNFSNWNKLGRFRDWKILLSTIQRSSLHAK